MSAQFQMDTVRTSALPGTVHRGKFIPAGANPLMFRDTPEEEMAWKLTNARNRANAKKAASGGFDEQMYKALREGFAELSAEDRQDVLSKHEWMAKSLGDGVQAAGFQTPVSGGDDLTPLVPQSIDDMLTEKVFRADMLNFVGTMPRARATNTVHEWRPLTSRGDEYMSAARQEGLTGSNDQSVAGYGSVQLKSYVNRREITDILGSLTGIGVSTSMLNLETNNASLIIRQAMEFDSLYGNATANPLEFTGAITAIVAQGNFTDMHTADGTINISTALIEEKLRELATDRYFYGQPTNIWAPPRVLSTLSKEINPQLRQDNSEENRRVLLGANSFMVNGMYRPLPVNPCQMLGTFRDRYVPTGNSANATQRPAAPSVTPTQASNASSRFFAADAGDYIYTVLAYNQYGYTKQASPSSVTVVAGNRVILTLADSAIADTTLYYQVYRTPLGETDAAKAQWIGKFPRATFGSNTVIYDYNDVLPGHFDLVVTQQEKTSMEMVQLLDLTRVPLAKVELTTPFAVFTSCALAMKAPEKMWVFRNIPPPSYG